MSKAAQALKAAASKSSTSAHKAGTPTKPAAKAAAAKIPVADRLGKPKPVNPSSLTKKAPKAETPSKVVTKVTVTETKGANRPVIRKAVTIAKPAAGKKMVALMEEIVHDAKEVTAKVEPIYETVAEVPAVAQPTTSFTPPSALDPNRPSLRPSEYRGLMSTTPPPRPDRDTLRSDATVVGTFALTKGPRRY